LIARKCHWIKGILLSLARIRLIKYRSTRHGGADTRLADRTLSGALAHIKDLARPANRSAGRNRPRPQGQPGEPTPAVKTIRAVTWLKSLREGEVCKPEVPAIKAGILTMPARIASGSSGQMATTVAKVHFNQHPART